MIDIHYDDTQLRKLFDELQPKNQARVFRAAFRSVARKLRKEAVKELTAARLPSGRGLHNASTIARGLRTRGFSGKKFGFAVTASSQSAKGRGMYCNSRGELKPILRWMEEGTRGRRTRKSYISSRRRVTPHFTGHLTPLKFMRDAVLANADNIAPDLNEQMRQAVVKIARKYGSRN